MKKNRWTGQTILWTLTQNISLSQYTNMLKKYGLTKLTWQLNWQWQKTQRRRTSPWRKWFQKNSMNIWMFLINKRQPWDHQIKIKEVFELKYFKNYSLMPQEQIEMEKFLAKKLEKGYIQPSKSPMASPFFFVEKKDGKLWLTQDYQYLNEWTIKNAYPLPLISDIINKLQGSKYFTKLDIQWGYNNVQIKEGDEWKAAFKTNKGLFEFTVMFFEMCNSSATFQNMMDHTFSDLIAQGFCMVYMDDILIHPDNKEDLEWYTKMVLQRLQENNIYLKPKKCKFAKKGSNIWEWSSVIIWHLWTQWN